MTSHIQFDLFKETTLEDVREARFTALEESHHAVRKKAFAEIRALTKMVLKQQDEIDFLKVKIGLSCYIEREKE